MKSIKGAVLALGLLFAGAFAANAQKVAFIDAQNVIQNMPELEQIQAKLKKYSEDSVGSQYEVILAEYKRKDSIIKDVKTAKAVKETAQKDFADLQYTLGNWEQIAGEAMQGKQAQLLQPVYKKVQDAINAVAKEKGYAYVLTREALLVVSEADNLEKAVMDKLGIKPRAATPAKP